ncbi:MAG: OsmC family protein [Pseudomarimonas sp.]
MSMKRVATAWWEGDLKAGRGAMSTPQSGLFADQKYSFNTRFGEEKGTNPEELLAASHAGCFSMALGFMLQNAGLKATRIDTRAEVTMEMVPSPSATAVHLTVTASVPDCSAEKFAEIAENAKKNCVISRALAIPVSMTATLQG